MSKPSESRLSNARPLRIGLKQAMIALAAILASATNLPAASTTSADARSAVTAWLQDDADPLGTRLGLAVDHVETFTDEVDAPLYHVVSLQPWGYVIVSADDLIEPIIAFSADGMYDPTAEDPLGDLVRADLKIRAARACATRPITRREGGTHLAAVTSSRTPTQQKWDALRSRNDRSRSPRQVKAIDRTEEIEDLRVWPLLQLDPNNETTWLDWGQSGYAVYRYDKSEEDWDRVARYACFNYYTPPSDPCDLDSVGDGDNYPAGCVATAQAILLRYHQWPQIEPDWIDPATGRKKTFSIKVTTDEAVTTRKVHLLGGSGENGAYNWDNMPAQPLAYNLEKSHCQEIGALCYDAGITVGMSYTATGSGAWVENLKSSLTRVFRYANAAIGYSDGVNILADLNNMVNPNLDSGHPVVFSIQAEDNSGGHAVICDGYGYHHGTLYHHLNTGWVDTILLDHENGDVERYKLTSDDVWYALPDINDMDQVTVDFDYLRACVYNVFPMATGEIVSGRVTDKYGKPLAEETVVLRLSGQTVDTQLTNANGIYAFVGCKSNTQYRISVPTLGYGDQLVQTGKSVDYRADSGNRWGVDFPSPRATTN